MRKVTITVADIRKSEKLIAKAPRFYNICKVCPIAVAAARTWKKPTTANRKCISLYKRNSFGYRERFGFYPIPEDRERLSNFVDSFDSRKIYGNQAELMLPLTITLKSERE